jgi:hypothetical protein
MTKDEALKLALERFESMNHEDSMFSGEFDEEVAAIKQALAQPPLPVQPKERYFCQRCGKRTADLTTIHTCTPPQENT